MNAGTRFPIRMDPVWRPLLLVGGAMQGNSYLEINGDHLVVRFGWLYQDSIQLEDIESVEEGDWPIWMGVGWRIGFGQRFGLIGSYDGIVNIEFKEPLRVWQLMRCKRMSVSLEDPTTFVAALGGLI